MDGTQFDALARRVGERTSSRRNAIAGAVGLVGAALLGREASAGEPQTCLGYKRRCNLHPSGSCALDCNSLHPHDKKARKECLRHCPIACQADCCSGFWDVKKRGRHKKALCGCQSDGSSCGFDYHCCSGVCEGGLCASSAGSCAVDTRHTCDTFTTCGSDERGACSCVKTLERGTVCGSDGAFPTPNPCVSTAQCVRLYGPGVVCQTGESGCAGQRCVVPCGFVAGSVAMAHAGAKANLVPNHRAR
ncbi:MAG TPA: hypothetical protein VFU81_09455 [Thermomicrobiales bacterium]|nr:hypothetical protein [Thermomicrobiales bacterium]